jgi:hypothetical protein
MKMTDELHAFYFFPHRWIAKTRGLTTSQRGIYFDLLCISHGKGLINDLDQLCRSVIPASFDLEELEKNRTDLIFVLNNKFVLKDNRYVNEFQEMQYDYAVNLKKKRSDARKSKIDNDLSEQKANNLDIGIGFGNDIGKDSYIGSFNNLWKLNSKSNSTRSSKPKSYQAFNKLSNEDQEIVLNTWETYQQDEIKNGDNYAKALERFIRDETFRSISSASDRKNEDEETKNIILKSKWEASKKHGKLLHNLTQNQFDEMEELYGK